ncbi:hypothetical protein [Finegoldia magna]|uniref:hypothetical protein n=1 Tax=Finegoldia magna TaxID=1260 RepID=UPI00290ED322|nr:hypothetical protein [Finegoldia magna]MDU5508045.1 hypothetical protein [Finegoldia magna]
MGDNGKKESKLRLVRLENKNIVYELSYTVSTNCKTFTKLDKNQIINYVNEFYLDANQIDYDKLLNDLNAFKSYRDDVDISVRKEGEFISYVALFVSLIAISVKLIDVKEIANTIFAVVLILAIVCHFYMMYNNGINSGSTKVITLNNAIYTLETIKEDMDRNGNSDTESDEIISSVNDKLDDGNTEDISTEDADDGNTEDITAEDADERYEGLELTEVKEIRTYKATKNKYSPRAMYERKRR